MYTHKVGSDSHRKKITDLANDSHSQHTHERRTKVVGFKVSAWTRNVSLFGWVENLSQLERNLVSLRGERFALA